MRHVIGELKADHVKVEVNPQADLIVVKQDADTVILAGLESIERTIVRLCIARDMIIAAQKETK